MRAAAAPDPSPAPARSMLKRLFDRQLLRVSPAERIVAVGGGEKDEVEPSSVCLDGMVRSFLEDGSGVGAAVERAGGHGVRRCNCFHGGGSSDDDDDEDDAAASSDVAETIKVGGVGEEEENDLWSFILLFSGGRAMACKDTDLAACRAGARALRHAPGAQPPRRRLRPRGAAPGGRGKEAGAPRPGGGGAPRCGARRRRVRLPLGQVPHPPRRRARLRRRAPPAGLRPRRARARPGRRRLPLRLRGRPPHQGLPRAAAAPPRGVRRQGRPPPPPRRRLRRRRARQPQEARPSPPAMAQARVHARQVAVPLRPRASAARRGLRLRRRGRGRRRGSPRRRVNKRCRLEFSTFRRA